MKKKRRSSISTELQIWTPKKKREPSPRRMDYAILPSDPFTLPHDWVVEKRKRTSGLLRGTTDTYYYEPGTGRKFRSLVSVQRYLTEPGHYEFTKNGDLKPKLQQSIPMPLSVALPSSLKPHSRSPIKPLSHNSPNNIQAYWKAYTPNHHVNIDRSKPLKLPDGWYVRKITRMSGQSMGRVDKYYCERATGRVFRSKLDVQRYLADNYMEENTTLSELFNPASLIQMSRSEDKVVNEESAMAIVPLSSYKDSYSSISDDVPLKNLVRKRDNVLLKDLVQKYDDVPLKNLVRESDSPEYDAMPLKNLVQESDSVPLKDRVQESDGSMPLEDLVQESDNVPLKDLVRKPYVARKNCENSKKLSSPKKNALSCTASRNTCIANLPNPPMKIKWVLGSPGGNAWSPFISDTRVSESRKEEWNKIFTDIVNQKDPRTSNSDAVD